MANGKHLSILEQGTEVWNEWWENHEDVAPDLSGADLSGADLSGVDLSGATLSEVDLHGADLSSAILYEADLSEAILSSANLRGVDLRGANLSSANLSEAILDEADLSEADLSGTNLHGAVLHEAILRKANLGEADLSEANLHGVDLYRADLRGTNLRGANLIGADLREASLVETDLTRANLSGSRIFGISAWKVNLEETIQSDLLITDDDEPIITADNLEVAQFIYLLLHNEKIREVIDTITSKMVLILGRFTLERKAVLNALREELRERNYTPVLFDFEKPSSKDLTETVITLASLARFVIADLSDPNSIPYEVASFARQFLSTPIQAIFCPVPGHENEFPMFRDLQRFHHILPIYRYENQEELIAALYEKVIQPAEEKVKELRTST